MEHEPLAIGFNCVAPRLFLILMDTLKINFYWGFYLNCGGEDYCRDRIVSVVDSVEYIEIIEKNLKYNPSFIGACCGSNPKHINAIRRFLNGKND
jgi:S-methylmethionine-dependent homocysteine/selenocysteine methylase